MVQTWWQLWQSKDGRSGQSACSSSSCGKTVVVIVVVGGGGGGASDAAVADVPAAAHEKDAGTSGAGTMAGRHNQVAKECLLAPSTEVEKEHPQLRVPDTRLKRTHFSRPETLT